MMQVTDNQPAIDAEPAKNGTGHGPDGLDDTEVAPSDNVSRASAGSVPGGFQPGNQLWRRRNKAPGLQSARKALREALREALTPDKMRDCVAKMLDIIASSDKKAAVQAFKVLADAAGVRGESDSSRAGPAFTFILPGPGAIPDGPAIVREGPLCKILTTAVTDSDPVEGVAEPVGS